MTIEEYKKLRDKKIKEIKSKHEEDLIAGRTIHKTIGEETKRNSKK